MVVSTYPDFVVLYLMLSLSLGTAVPLSADLGRMWKEMREVDKDIASNNPPF